MCLALPWSVFASWGAVLSQNFAPFGCSFESAVSLPRKFRRKSGRPPNPGAWTHPISRSKGNGCICIARLIVMAKPLVLFCQSNPKVPLYEGSSSERLAQRMFQIVLPSTKAAQTLLESREPDNPKTTIPIKPLATIQTVCQLGCINLRNTALFKPRKILRQNL